MALVTINPLAQAIDRITSSASGGTVTIVSSMRSFGRAATRCEATTTGTAFISCGRVLAGGTVGNAALSPGYFTFHVKFDVFPAANSEVFFRVSNSTATAKIYGRINSTGTVAIYDSANTLVATGSTVLTTGTVYRMCVRAVNSAAGTVELYIAAQAADFGAAEISATCNHGATSADRIQLGKVIDSNGQTVDYAFQDLVIDSTSPRDHFNIAIGLANGDGANTAFTGTSADVDEFPHDGDTTVISSATAGAIETCTMQNASDISIGSGDTIHAIQGGNVRKSVAGDEACNVTFVSGASTTHTGGANLGATYEYGGFLKLLDPADSAAWTPAKYDGIEIGCKVTNALLLTVTEIMAYVMFTAAPAAGNPWHYYQQQMVG